MTAELAGKPDYVDQTLDRVVDRRRLSHAFDASRLQADLEGFTEADWTPHPARTNYEGAWSAIALRAAQGETHPLRLIYPNPGAAVFVEAPMLARCPYMREVLATFMCPLRSVRLMRLGAGSQIKEHCDPGLDAEHGHVRLHVPITTDPDVEFYLNDTRVEMAAGSTWYLRLTDPHRVLNRGRADRVHLTIDAEVNDWLSDLLR
jgi:hypothetical protein